MSSSALTKAGEPASRTVPTSRRMPTPYNPSEPGASARTARTQAVASSTVRTSANSTL